MASSNIVCISGGIGAGKSVVSRILRLRGFEVFDCDMEARMLMESDIALRSAITALIGEDAYGADGHINRAAVAARIFGSEVMRNRLNALVHPAVRREMSLRAEALSKEGKILFVETAIPSASGLYSLCRELWLVEAPAEMRVKAVMERSALSREEAVARVEAQKAEYDIKNIPVYTLINDRNSTPLIECIDSLLRRLKIPIN